MNTQEITTEKRSAIAAKIRALRAKTVENGCSEAEALSAIAMVEQLMDRYRFEKSDLDQAEPEKYGKGSRSGYGTKHRTSMKWHPTVNAWSKLSGLAGVKVWVSSTDATVHAFGAEQDILSFWHYMDLVRMASETAWAGATHLSGYSDKVAFMRGFCDGVNTKISGLMKERDKEQTVENKERGLMRISRDQILRTKYQDFAAREGMHLRSRSYGGGGRGSSDAHSSGHVAGSKVGFGGARPSVGGGAKRLN